MTRRLLVVLAFVGFSLFVNAQEKIVLSTPVFVDSGATEFRVASLYLKRAVTPAPAEIQAVFREVSGTSFLPNGRSLTCNYIGDEAEAKLIALNKANLSTISLERRITATCQADKKLGSGTITGVPE
jgi:hypothetical protein